MAQVSDRQQDTEGPSGPVTDACALLMTSSVALLLVGADERVLSASTGAERLFGYGDGEMGGLCLAEVLPPADGLRQGRRRDGALFPVELTVRTVQFGGATAAVFVTDRSAVLALENELAESRASLRRMAFDMAVLERRIRRRIALTLHDGLGQTLIVAQMKLGPCRPLVSGPARALLDETLAVLAGAIGETRSLTMELSSPLGRNGGLRDALHWLADDLRKRLGLETEVQGDEGEAPLDDDAQALLFRAAREFLTNVFKHARVPAARMTLRRDAGRVVLVVEDAGGGFDVGAATERAAARTLGLFSVRQQLEERGGELVVDSAPGRGTLVTASLPLDPRQAEGASPCGVRG